MRLILLFILPTLLLSCSRYQYLKVQPVEDSVTNDGDIIFENDSVKVTYDFFGVNGPLRVTVFNKLPEGLTMDWSKSALILGEQATSFSEPVLEISGEVSRSRSVPHTASLQATAEGKETTVFLPPQSSTTRTGLMLVKGDFFPLEKKPANHRKAGAPSSNTRLYMFDRDKSPLVFRVYLTLVSGNANSTIIDRSFYISEIIETGKRPVEKYREREPGNIAFIQKQDYTKGLLIFFGVLGVVTVAGAAGP
jgi:hypothetical protein